MTAPPGFTLLARLRLALELRRWRRLGARPALWWRDDDARTTSVHLERLLGAASGRPLALAVIPDGDLPRLAQRLRASSNVSVGQHGVDHHDRSGGLGPPSEYPHDATHVDMVGAISEARARMESAGLAPCFFIPPWNACQPSLAQALVAAGFDCLSAGKDIPPQDELRYVSAQIDILRWKDGPRFKGSSRILKALLHALKSRRHADETGAPIGLLTHHLVHDEESWRFLAWFAPYADHRFDWVSIGPGR